MMLLLLVAGVCKAQNLQLNDKEYFERQGVNVLIFNLSICNLLCTNSF